MPRRGEQSARTKAICEAYKRALAVDGDHLAALRAVSAAFEMKTTAVRNTLVRSGVVARRKDDREQTSPRYRGKDRYQASLETRKAEEAPPPTFRDPCFQCGTRWDIGCKHRPPSGAPAPTMTDPLDRPRTANGQGYNFGKGKLVIERAMARLRPSTRS